MNKADCHSGGENGKIFFINGKAKSKSPRDSGSK